MKLTRWDPLQDVDDMFDRYTRAIGWPLQRRGRGLMPMSEEGWSPRVDVSETDKHFLIKAEVPGIKREDVKISIEDNILTISGERKEEKEEQGSKYYRSECCYGSFSRSFSLPQNVDEDKIEANFKDGMLTLQIPKKEAAKTKKIEVKIH